MILHAIKNRRSVREYKSKLVSDKDILEIIKAAQFAPSARHNMAVEFIVIKEQKTKEAICEIINANRQFKTNQDYVKNVPVLLIPVTDKNKTEMPIQDLSVASENIFLQAAVLGLGTVWKNIWPEIEEEMKKLLGLPINFTLINIIPIGYPQEKIEPHSDKDFSQKKIHYEKW